MKICLEIDKYRRSSLLRQAPGGDICCTFLEVLSSLVVKDSVSQICIMFVSIKDRTHGHFSFSLNAFVLISILCEINKSPTLATPVHSPMFLSPSFFVVIETN